jgi:hypothetical protein
VTVRRPFTVIEIDLPTCANTYGTAPCTAAVGVTGDQRCFNTRRTCQDLPNLVANTTTLRVCMATENLPYDAIPCLEAVSVTPGVIDPGRSIGTRGKVSFSCAEFPTGDALLDRYLGTRTYDPFTQGTFWAKLRARIPSLQRCPVRVMRGELGDDLSTYRTEHYFVETALLSSDGAEFVAKDALSFCDPSKALCPTPSTGRLAAGIDDSETSASLVPAGIGDAEYAASGWVCLGGKEICAFTRSGDALTLTRAQRGTTAKEHDADAIVQTVQVYTAASAAAVTYSLLVDFTPGVEAAWCDLTAWQEDANYIGHLYEATIPAPTSVKLLLDEMMVQAGCSIWWDPELQVIRFQTLRPVTTSDFVLDGQRMLESAFAAKEQPDKRVSRHETSYGMADPTNTKDREANYRASVLTIDATSEEDYGAVAYERVFARWISIDNRPAADRLNLMKLARYRDPPRAGGFALFATSPYLPAMGTGVPVQDASLQQADGSAATVPFYVTSVKKKEDVYEYTVEEILFTDQGDGARTVYIEVDKFNVNLRTLYDTLYSNIPEAAVVKFYVTAGSYVGGQILGGRSLDVGDWPEDAEIQIYNGTSPGADAKILGRGGNGGTYPAPTPDGEAGSTALYTRRPIRLWNYGTIAGGGGGGQARVGGGIGFSVAGGGGGAGFNGYFSIPQTDPPTALAGARRGGNGGAGGEDPPATAGTPTLRGFGANSINGTGGKGGGLAQDGYYFDGTPGHSSAGAAIDGHSYVTYENVGTIQGAQIN